MSEPRPFIDFYTSKGIIPTRQNISDLDAHFRRRETLYRHLGIPKCLLRGISIIEFGPGSGHNALFTASCQPGCYILVDATPASLESTRARLAESFGGDHIRVVESEILAFQTDEKFDLVLCEGVIPTQRDPVAFLKHVASFARPAGLVVITCMDPIAVLPEILRRYVGRLVTADITDFQLQIEALVKFFDQDLRSLTGMSRRFEDWVVDQMLHPWSGPLLSVSEAVDGLSADFEIYASSPHFLVDWRWYKEVLRDSFGFNQIGKVSYFSQMHNFLDHRFVCPPREPSLNIRLSEQCDKIYQRVFAWERGERQYPVTDVLEDLETLGVDIQDSHPATREAIADFARCLKTGKISDLSSFRNLWGRGQQYISFIRNE
jgi:SAM-dependent methyltransferase